MLRFQKTHPDAIPPTKNNASDAGYDLHLMELKEQKDGVYKFDTQIAIELPDGYFGMLVPRSSIVKSGFEMANSVGIIDNHYRGSIIVALRKTNPDVPDLQLPIKLVQFVPMKQYDFYLEETTELTQTDRGDAGGLGSRQFVWTLRHDT